MQIEIYAIKDKKSGFFLKPFDTRSQVEALRSVKQVVNDPASTLNKFPEDYALYLLGKLDDENGIIAVDEFDTPSDRAVWTAPHHIIDIINLMEKK